MIGCSTPYLQDRRGFEVDPPETGLSRKLRNGHYTVSVPTVIRICRIYPLAAGTTEVPDFNIRGLTPWAGRSW
jgi:hypothetical protein